MQKALRFHIHTLGCKVNSVESDSVAAKLLDRGWTLSEQDDADITLINTCTVTAEAEAKNRKIIRRALRSTSGPILVMGCAVNIAADTYSSLNRRIVCETDKSRAVERIYELLGLPFDTAPHEVYGETPRPDSALRNREGFRTRIGVKVQDGCDNACTYCIVHTARGAARSTPCEEVIGEVTALADSGTAETILVGIDLGAYKDGETRLSDLLQALIERTGIRRIRLSSIEPQSIDAALIARLASSSRFCRHLHIPLQSGSQKVLGEMARRYSPADYLETVKALRTAMPDIALSTDVLVGFPGESDEDFEETYSFVREVGFMKLHIFRYSRRDKTPAAERDDQIDPKIVAARAQRLRLLGEELARKDRESRIGTQESVIIEDIGRGTSESYHTVICDREFVPGSLVNMSFTGISQEQAALIGEAIPSSSLL